MVKTPLRSLGRKARRGALSREHGSGEPRHLRSLDSEITGDHEPTTAFVLSGGGHLGAIQVGMLRALFEAGITPDVYVATSVGALNASVCAAIPGIPGVDHLEDTWRRLETEDLLPASSVEQAVSIARGRNHLHPSSGVVSVITSAVPATHFHDLSVPLRIVTTELTTGEERVFAAGSLMRPLLATTAIPGLLPPVQIGGELFVDGGVVNNVAISHAVECDRVFALALSDPQIDEIPSSSWGMLMRGYAMSRAMRLRLDIERYMHETELIVVPMPQIPDDVKFPDMSFTPELITAGYLSTRAFLENGCEAAPPADDTMATPTRAVALHDTMLPDDDDTALGW